MSFLVTKQAPDFTARAVMPDNNLGDLTLSSYRGKYVVLFFHPPDFAFACPTEIISTSDGVARYLGKHAV